MKYLLFAGECCYANGGAHDIRGYGDDVESLNALGRRLLLADYELDQVNIEWWHIMDMETLAIIAGSYEQAHGAGYLTIGERE